MKKMFLIIIIVSLFISLFFIYEYPIQKALAMKKFYKYIKLQGVNEENIVDMEVYKDYKMGGYEIKLKYKDDIENTYFYHYEPFYVDILKGYVEKDSMCLNILSNGYRYSTNNEEWNKKNGIKVKYKPLEDK